MSVEAYSPDKQTFELAVINELDYEHTRDCPHCNQIGMADRLMTINSISAKPFQGVLRSCMNCHLPFLVLAYPILPTEKPVYLDWSFRADNAQREWIDWLGM